MESNYNLQVFVAICFEIIKIAIINKIILNHANSSPANGRNKSKPPYPSSASIPNPHNEHVGTKVPKRIAIPLRPVVFLFNILTVVIL